MNSRRILFLDWCRDEQSKLLEQIRWLETGGRRLGHRTEDGPWIDITNIELKRLRQKFARLCDVLDETKQELVG